MANKFPIEITADDAVIATIKRINKSLEMLLAPAKRLNAYTAKLAKVGGLEQLNSGMRRFVGAAKAAADHMTRLMAPLFALIGGASIAGIAAMTAEWARFGFALSQTARTLGVSVENLQALRGAAIAMGLAEGDMTAGLKQLGDTLEDALYGRNQMALIMLNRMGISIRRNKDGAIDSVKAFKDLAGVISQIRSPQVQGLVAREFGLEALLPILRQGPKAIDAYMAKAREMGAVMSGEQLAASDRFGQSLNYLQLAAVGLRNEIAGRLAPGFAAFVSHLTTWIEGNRGRIGDFFAGLGSWLARLDFDKIAAGATRFLDSLSKIVDKLGGFKTIAIALGGVMLANLLAPFATLLSTMVLLVPALGAAWPILAAIAALGGLAAGGFAAYRLLHDYPNGLSTSGGGHGIGAGQNNPTNLRHWGLQPEANGFAMFSSPLQGLIAPAKQLELYGSRGIDSISGIISKWAPSADGNNPESYARDVGKWTGLDPNAHLNLRDPSILSPLLSAIVRKESGSDYKIDPNDLRQAVTAGIEAANASSSTTITVNGLPVGTSVTARNSQGTPVPVGTSMPGRGP